MQNYKKLCDTIKHGDVWRTFSMGIIPQLTRPCHSISKIVRMTSKHPTLSHTRLATLKSTEFVPKARNKALPDPTSLNNNGIQIHEWLIWQFFTTFTQWGARNSCDGYTPNQIYACNYSWISSICKEWWNPSSTI